MTAARANAPMPSWSLLVGEGALHTLRVIARAIPDLGHGFGFECRLGEGETTVDLGIVVRPDDVREPPVLPTSAPWTRIAGFFRSWTAPGSALAWRVPFMFLEFDADAAAADTPVPSVFASFDWPLDEPQRGAFEVAREVLELLRGVPVPATVRECFAALPEGGRVVHAGAMLGRDGGIRLSLALPRRALGDVLGTIGCTDAGAVEAIVARFGADEWRVHVECDCGYRLGEATGVVLAGADERAWRRLLDRLVDVGLCAPTKRAALLAWPGVSPTTPPRSAEPRMLRRALSHVKVSHTPGRALAAKAYVTVT